MSLLTGLSRLFGGSRPARHAARPRVHSANGSPDGTARARSARPVQPAVVIDISDAYDDDIRARHDATTDDAGTIDTDPIGTNRADADDNVDDDGIDIGDPAQARSRFLPVVRNKQDLINDLQKRYTEVVELIKKVDTHLDEQSKRQERLLEIAETIPATIATLPDIQEQMHAQTTRLTNAIEQLTEATVRGTNRTDAAMTRQMGAIEQLVIHAADTAHTQSRVVGSLTTLAEGVAKMHEAGAEMGSAMSELRAHETMRDAALAEAAKGQRSVTTIAAAASIAAALSVIALVVLIATGTV